MNSFSEVEKAYIAGFLDGDGSVYVKLTKNKSYKFRYQVSAYISFYQSQIKNQFLEEIQKKFGCGYLRKRKDGISEFILGDEKSQIEFIEMVLPYSKLKKKQLKLMGKILKYKKEVKNADDFLKICALVDEYRLLNYSKKRKILTKEVKKTLRKEGLITP